MLVLSQLSQKAKSWMQGRTKNRGQILGIAAALLGILTGFQNCSNQVHFQSPTTGDSSLLSTEIPNGAFKINNGAIYTNNQMVTLQIASSNAAKMFITNDACPNTPPDAAHVANADTQATWLLADKDGTSTVSMMFQSTTNKMSGCITGSITLDRKAPTINFTKTPDKMTSSNVALFSIAANDDLSGVDTIYCKLSGQKDYAPCDVNLNLPNMPEGTDTLSVYANDKAGNSSAPVDYSWLVDLTPPTVAITDPKPLALSTVNAVMVNFKGDDGTGSGVAGYKCTLNDQPIANCTSPAPLTNLTDGNYAFKVWAIDNVGLMTPQPAEADFTIDTKASGDFQILGITGGADTKVDSYLTDLSATVLNWSASSTAQSYTGTIYDATGTTAVCGPVTFTATLTSSTMGANCKLTDNTHYVARMSAFRNGLEKKAPDFPFLVDASGPIIQVSAPTTDNTAKTAMFTFAVSDLGSGVQTATCYRVAGTDIRQDDCTKLTTITYSNLAVGNYTFYITATDVAGNMSQLTPVPFAIQNVVCDPFHLVAEATCQKGLKANLYYASAAQLALGNATLGSTTFKTVGLLIANGVKSNTVVYMPFLDVQVRDFTEGFGTTAGTYLADDSGAKLDEWFALSMTSFMKLGPNDVPGYYQIIVASDDGSNFYTDVNNTGTYTKIINNDGTHSNTVGCTVKGGEVYMTANTRMPIKVEYYQGPRTEIAMSVFWRPVPAAGSTLSTHCGYSSSTFTDWYGTGTPATGGMYSQLAAEGFVAPQSVNYISN